MDEGIEDAVRLLVERSSRALPYDAAFTPLPEAQQPEPIVAVDGSHALLADQGAVWVGAVCAAPTLWPGDTPRPQPNIIATTAAEAQHDVDACYDAHGLQAPPVHSADAWLEARAALAEMEAGLTGGEQAAGGLLLLDGAYEAIGRRAQPLLDRVTSAAARHGATVIGVAKRSRLDRDGVPLVTALHQHGPEGVWASEVPDYSNVFVARMHARARHAFRIDSPSVEAIASLLPLCRDAAYLGYPYPLAVAHNRVAMTGTRAAALKDRLERALRAAGVGAALDDFHAVLDRNVPG